MLACHAFVSSSQGGSSKRQRTSSSSTQEEGAGCIVGMMELLHRPQLSLQQHLLANQTAELGQGQHPHHPSLWQPPQQPPVHLSTGRRHSSSNGSSSVYNGSNGSSGCVACLRFRDPGQGLSYSFEVEVTPCTEHVLLRYKNFQYAVSTGDRQGYQDVVEQVGGRWAEKKKMDIVRKKGGEAFCACVCVCRRVSNGWGISLCRKGARNHQYFCEDPLVQQLLWLLCGGYRVQLLARIGSAQLVCHRTSPRLIA